MVGMNFVAKTALVHSLVRVANFGISTQGM